MRSAFLSGIALVASASCGPSLSPSGGNEAVQPPGESPTVESQLGVTQEMAMWLRQLRSVQGSVFSIDKLYCSEVTCGGQIKPLRPPYKTKYWSNPSGKSYRVDVYHEDTQRTCHLEEGFDAYPDRAGVIICD